MAAEQLTGSADLSEEEQEAVELLLFRLADDEFVIAERYTEWQVRSPTLESDLAVANIAQDELGHARLWYDLLEDFDYKEQDLIWERPADQWRHSTLTELPRPEGGWEDVIVRGYLYDAAEDLRLDALVDSSYGRIRDRVGKVRGEEGYHLEHAQNWLERLTEDEAGRERVQSAVDRQFPHALTLFEPADEELEARIDDLGLRTMPLTEQGEAWLERVVPFLESLGVETPMTGRDEVTADMLPEVVGRDGTHTDDWFDLYEDFTHTYNQIDVGDPVRIMKDPNDE